MDAIPTRAGKGNFVVALLRITEFSGPYHAAGGPASVPYGAPVAEQTLDFSTDEAQSDPVSGPYVRLHAVDAACYLTFDGSPSSVDRFYIPQGGVETLGLPVGSVVRVADDSERLAFFPVASGFLETLEPGTVLGRLAVVNSDVDSWTYTLTDNLDDAVDLDGDEVVVGASGLDYETASVLSLEATADDGDSGEHTLEFDLPVLNVLEVELEALTLSADDFFLGIAEGTTIGSIVGATAGSTITLTDDAGGRFDLDEASIVLGDEALFNFRAQKRHTITLRETHPDAFNSPRYSDVTITLKKPTLVALTISADEIESGAEEDTEVGTISGATAGSTVTLTDDAGGRFALVDDAIVAGAVATDVEEETTHTIVLTETHPNATNSPRTTSIEITVVEPE